MFKARRRGSPGAAGRALRQAGAGPGNRRRGGPPGAWMGLILVNGNQVSIPPLAAHCLSGLIACFHLRGKCSKEKNRKDSLGLGH